jgi:uracil-DNA glycosylase
MEYLYESDLLEVDAQIIAQQCNCVTRTGKGLSLEIAKKFPHADFYSKRTKPSIPGTIEVRGGKGQRWVCAMYAQYHPGPPSTRGGDTSEKRLEWFRECLDRIGQIKNLRHIAFPDKIGCGLARGDWDAYYGMLYHFAEHHSDVRVTIVSKDPAPDDGHPYDDDGWCDCLGDGAKHNERGQVYVFNSEGEQTDYWSDTESYTSRELPPKAPPIPPSYETTSLVEYTRTHLPKGWEDFFNDQLDPEMGALPEISAYLEKEALTHPIFPPLWMIYTSFHFTTPDDILVLILGQDPYHNDGQAMGISFSVPDGVYPPPSLKNIYKEMVSSGIQVSDPDSGNLTAWCHRGVFLINTALTVRAHTPKSHSKKWVENFTPALLRWMDDRCNPLVVIMWGNDAQSLGKYFGDRHRKIASVHPSPLSASGGFFGSNPFNKANKYLKELGRPTVDWSL